MYLYGIEMEQSQDNSGKGAECSNCTFMELKFEWHGGKLRTESSNCTFMELKLLSSPWATSDTLF